MKKVLNIMFCEGSKVVLKTDPVNVRVVSGFLVRGKNIQYGLTKGDEETFHYAVEIEPTQVTGSFKVRGFK